MAATAIGSRISDRSLLLITLSLVIVLGVPVGISLFLVPTVNTIAVAPATTRSPASVQLLTDQSLDSSLGSSLSVEVGCSNAIDLGLLKSAHLRLKATTCFGENEIEVINKTNGFTAQTLPMSEKQYTTDYIDLSEGLNVLEITRTEADGTAKVQSIQVTREPASSVDQ